MLSKLKQNPCLSIFLLSLFFFSLATACTEINKIDVRFAIMLQDMKDSPFSLFPTINGIPYPDYFSFYFFLPYLTTLGGHWVNMWSMTLPSQLLGSFVIAMTYRLGEKVQPQLGLWAALLLLSVFEVVFTVCAFGIDMSVAAISIIMLTLLQRDPGKIRTHIVFAVFAFLAVLLRGSLGIIVFGASAAGFILMQRRWKWIFSYGFSGLLGAVSGITILLFAIYAAGGKALYDTFLEWQIGRRIAGGDYFYYFLDGIISYAPVTFFAIGAMLYARKKNLAQPLASWIGFFLLPTILLSAPGGKHLRYLIAFIPALALTGAWGMLHYPAQIVSKITCLFYKGGRYLPLVCFAGLVIMAGICIALFPAALIPWLNWFAALLLFLAIWRICKDFQSPCSVYAAVTACLLTIYCGIAIPMTGMLENASLFVRSVEAKRTGKLWFFELGPDHEDLKYVLHMDPAKRKEIRYMNHILLKKTSLLAQMYPTQLTKDVLPILSGEDILILKKNRLPDLEKQLADAGRIITEKEYGKLGHREYCAVRTAQRP